MTATREQIAEAILLAGPLWDLTAAVDAVEALIESAVIQADARAEKRGRSVVAAKIEPLLSTAIEADGDLSGRWLAKRIRDVVEESA